jgi:GNAT superfamily N-acetyltransferase
VSETVIRAAADDDLSAVARLRWRWVAEQDGEPMMPLAEFEHVFLAWAKEHAGSHFCTVLVRQSTVIGMAWLAVLPRVPSPRAPERYSGDLQCVYVVPEHRDGGLGARLLAAVVDRAAGLGMERVTVHSSPAAVSAYIRAGFASSGRLMQTRPMPSEAVRSSGLGAPRGVH